MDMRLELIVLPVADVDRSKAFYERAGFSVDGEHGWNDVRIVQMTPKGSSCSITIGKGIPQAEPGSTQGLHLVVADLERAIADLAERGIETGTPFHISAEGETDGLHPSRESYGSFARLTDPDGNLWLLQEVREHVR